MLGMVKGGEGRTSRRFDAYFNAVVISEFLIPWCDVLKFHVGGDHWPPFYSLQFRREGGVKNVSLTLVVA